MKTLTKEDLIKAGEFLNLQGYQIDLSDDFWMEDTIFGEHRVKDVIKLLYEFSQSASQSDGELPTDIEVEKWFDINIVLNSDCSASSAIYKFRQWLNERQATHPVKVDGRDEMISDILGVTEPWPLSSVLFKLVEAANILLIEKSYDGHGYEEIELCVSRAKETIKKIETLKRVI